MYFHDNTGVSMFKPGLQIVSVICAAFFLLFSFVGSSQASGTDFDLVIVNGKVIDPASGLEAVRNIGIVGGRIAVVSGKKLKGAETINAKGLVVAPGFIDLHSHAQNIFGQTYHVMDGVTTALELEAGTQLAPFLDILAQRQGKSLINYGYSAGYRDIRFLVKVGTRFQTSIPGFRRANHEEATPEELDRMISMTETELNEGALGIGIPLDYMSRGMKSAEVESLFRLAAKHKVPLFIHQRMTDDATDPAGLVELIDMTRKTGASLHVVHIGSTGLGRVPLYLKMITEARAEGLDITTEVYPYTAASASINSGIFDHDWKRTWGISYEDVEWPPTGERFTGEQMWNDYRARYPDGIVIMHAMKEKWVEAALKYPGVIVASDAMRLKSLTHRQHPRGMGTFSRVLGYYARDKKILSLSDAIAKMSYLPAKRLEDFAPAFKHKGRLTPGADADITIFDADTVIDRATFEEPNQYARGIIHVIVGGEVVVRDAALQDHVFPGQPITTKTNNFKIPK